MKYLHRFSALYGSDDQGVAPVRDMPGQTLYGALTNRTHVARQEPVDVHLAAQKLPRQYSRSSTLLQQVQAGVKHRQDEAERYSVRRKQNELRLMYTDIATHPERGPLTSAADARFWKRLHRLEFELGLPLTKPLPSHVVQHDNNAPIMCVPAEPAQGAAPIQTPSIAPTQEAPGYYGAVPFKEHRECPGNDAARALAERAAAHASISLSADAERLSVLPTSAPDANLVARARNEYQKSRTALYK